MPTGDFRPLAKPTRRKLDRHRFDGLPLAKNLRVVDATAIAAPRKNYCEHCGIKGIPIHRHHVKSKGSGGSDLLTVDICWRCHDLVHRGKISRAEIEEILLKRVVSA